VFDKDSLKGLSVAIKGIGKVGYQLVNYLVEDGVKIYVADNNVAQIDLLKPIMEQYPFMITAVSTDDIHKQDVDIYSPCALGNDIKIARISEMKCKIICGAANNQLDIIDTAIAKRQLLDQKITYVPDTLANVGGVFRSAGVILKSRDEQESFQMIETVHDRTIKILGFATQANINPADVCNEIGQAINGKPNRFKMDLNGISGVRFGNNTYRI
jgi:leucine dehydrogenase